MRPPAARTPLRSLRSLGFTLVAGLPVLLGAPAVSSAGDAGEDALPPVSQDAGNPGDDAAAAEKRRKAELLRRKDELPASARPALALIEAFREKELRVWGTFRRELTALGKDAVPALLLGLEESDWETRAFAASCLGEMREPTAVGAIADACARESFGEARRQYALAASKIAVPSAVPFLVRALDDAEIGVRLAAMEGLGGIAGPAEIPAIRLFADDAEPDLRYAARGNLAALGDADAIRGLVAECAAVAAIEKDARADSPYFADNDVRWTQYLLGMALVRAADPRAESLVTAILSGARPWDRRDFLRMGVAIGAGQLAARTGQVHPKLAAGITDSDERVRVACTYGAGFARSPDLVPRLVKALGDNRTEVRVNAAAALGRTGTEDALAGLRRALDDKQEEVRVAAIRALGLIRAPAATQALLLAARDEKYMLRVLAVRRLAERTAEPGVVEALTRAGRDADFGVREAAVAALGHHRDPAAVHAPVAAALADPDVGVQSNALLALAKLGPANRAADDDGIARRAVSLLVSTPRDKLRRAAEEFLDAVRPRAALAPLVDALGNDGVEARRRAHVALLRITEKAAVPFDPDAPKVERDAAQRRWREWAKTAPELPARGARVRQAVTGSLAETARDLKWKGLDIAILVDSTYSMSGLLNATREHVSELAEDLGDLLPSVRISMYTYRDFTDDYVFYGTPLTFDTWKLQGFLQYTDANQGRDLPEAVDTVVMNCARNLRWREDAHKVIVFAGDAAHHREDDAKFTEFIRGWFTKERRAVLHALYTDTNRRSLDVKARDKRELASARFPVLEVYQRTAEAGRGKGVMLDDEAGLIKELLVLTFGDAWRADVENLLDFER